MSDTIFHHAATARPALRFSAATAAVLATLLIPMSLALAGDSTQTGQARCAVQDLKLEHVLSDSILSQELQPDHYVAAAEFRLAARKACADFRFETAMSLYEQAARQIGMHLGPPGIDGD